MDYLNKEEVAYLMSAARNMAKGVTVSFGKTKLKNDNYEDCTNMLARLGGLYMLGRNGIKHGADVTELSTLISYFQEAATMEPLPAEPAREAYEQVLLTFAYPDLVDGIRIKSADYENGMIVQVWQAENGIKTFYVGAFRSSACPIITNDIGVVKCQSIADLNSKVIQHLHEINKGL